MKFNLIFLPLICLCVSCSGSQSETENTEPGQGQKPADMIVGNWQMDSSVYINDGIRGTVSAPLLPTTWTFAEDGKYLVENSLKMHGTFSRTEDSLFVVLMAVPNNYEILILDETHLHLRSTILENDSVSMKTDAYLTRIQN